MRLFPCLYTAVLLFNLNLQGIARDRNLPSEDHTFDFIASEKQSILSGSSALFHHSACKETAQQSVLQKLPVFKKQFSGEMLPSGFPKLIKNEVKAICILKTGCLLRRPMGTNIIYPFNYFW